MTIRRSARPALAFLACAAVPQEEPERIATNGDEKRG